MLTYSESSRDWPALVFEAAALCVVVVAWGLIPQHGGWNAFFHFAEFSALMLAWAGTVAVDGGVKAWFKLVNRTPKQIYLDFRTGKRRPLTPVRALCYALAWLVFLITVVT